MKNILMNVEMTKAILDGRKVQTRRVVKDVSIIDAFLKNGGELNKLTVIDRLAKYQIGETIWIREPAMVLNYSAMQNSMQCKYQADGTIKSFMIPPRIVQNGGIDYPRWITKTNEGKSQGIPNGCIKEMARIFLKITDVRVERLQDITQKDIYYEGIEQKTYMIDHVDGYAYRSDLKDYAYQEFMKLWNSTAPKGYKWEDNPYVFVYEFERV